MFNEKYLASYASFSSKSRGRLNYEPIAEGRSQFQRDRDRIIHSAAFRRLEYKTQVFLYNEGDHYRTRLTHSIEVSQIARSLSRFFGLDEDLTETISLAHDMGHSPFGHAGEYALEDCMKPYGGFDHNAQSVRIVTKLERKYANFAGLNLTWETLEGLAKHNGPIKKQSRALREFNDIFDLKLDTYASMEAQIAAIADDIAYNSHDIEDGIRANLFTLNDLVELPHIGFLIRKWQNDFPKSEPSILINEVRSEFIKIMVGDVINQTNKNLTEISPKNADDVRNCGKQIVFFGDSFNQDLKKIRKFLFENMYKHSKVLIMTNKARRVVTELFEFYLENPECLSDIWKKDLDIKDKHLIAVRVADFIAGMTDRYAFKRHEEIYNTSKTII